MALIHCDFFSETLGFCTSMYVILPQNTESQIGLQNRSFKDKHPTLLLLHGLSDDHTIWLRRTSIERYVAPLGIAVVMPAVHRSFYTDMAYGYKYWTFVKEELPSITRSFFPLSDKREDNFVVGLSMGGYGAFKLALNQPEKFIAAGSFSGCLDIVKISGSEDISEDMKLIYDDLKNVKESDNNLLYAMKKAADNKKALPILYQYCGTEDFLYEDNQAFRKTAESLSIDLTYVEDSGSHEWQYWDKQINKFLQWLMEKKLLEPYP